VSKQGNSVHSEMGVLFDKWHYEMTMKFLFESLDIMFKQSKKNCKINIY